jgi:hypothetical protein
MFIITDFFKFEFNINNVFQKAWLNSNDCFNDPKLKNLKLKVVNKNFNNLRKIFVFGDKLSLKNFNYSCNPCNENSCKVCHFF